MPNTERLSPAQLADRCEEAAKYLKSAASALRHGRWATARQRIADAETIIAFVKWRWSSTDTLVA